MSGVSKATTRTAAYQAMTFETVFDESRQGFTSAWLPLLAFGAFGACVVLNCGFGRRYRRTIMAMGALAFVVGLLLGPTSLLVAFHMRRTAAFDLSHARYATAEGPIADYVPMTMRSILRGGTFTVAGHRFVFSTQATAPAFDGTRIALRNGLVVRIAYSGNDILRFEVAR